MTLLPVGETSPEFWTGIGTLVVAAIGAGLALLKVGPERQTSMVGAQDTVIDNLREEVERQRRERDVAISELEQRHAIQLNRLKEQMDRDAAECERRVSNLQQRLETLERKEGMA